MKRISLLIPILVMAVLNICSVPAHALNVSATVDRARITMNGYVLLTITVEGEKQQLPDANLPAIEDFHVSPAGTSTSIRFVNMKMSASRIQRYQLYPKKTGTFTIPSITVADGSDTASSQPVKIEVVDDAGGGGSSSGSPNSGAAGGTGAPSNTQNNQPAQIPGSNSRPSSTETEKVFLEAKIDKSEPVVGQQIILTLTLYTAIDIVDYEMVEEPSVTGFWKETLSPVRGNKRVQINGVNMIAAEVGRFALFPTTSGELTVDPAVLRIAVRSRGGGRSPFGSFFDDDFFGMMSTQRYDLRSRPLKIKVEALPDSDKPDDFSGPTGRFKLSATLDRNELEAGEAVTVQVKVEGQGNVKMIPEPDAPEFKGFETFGNTSSSDITPSPEGIFGSKTFDYVLLAEEEGKQKIDSFRLSYFDPVDNKYKTVRTNPLEVIVKPGKERITPVNTINTGGSELRLSGRDISFIREIDRPLRKKTPLPLLEGNSPWLHITGIIIVLISTLLARRNRMIRGDRSYYRRSFALRSAIKRMKTIKRNIEKKSVDWFYSELEKVVREYVADCLNREALGIAVNELHESLTDRGIGERLIIELNDIIDILHAGRFAPGGSGRENQERLMDRVEKLINAMEGEWQ